MIKRKSDQLIDTTLPHFPQRRDGTFARGNAIGVFRMLPGLRGLWPMSSTGDNGEAMDMSGQGRHLSLAGLNISYIEGSNIMWTPYINVNSGPRWLYRTDEAGLDITGHETYIVDSGLTMGAWVQNPSTIPAGANRLMMGKWASAGNQRSYALQMASSATPLFTVSSNGTNVYEVRSPQTIYNSNGERWQFICGRYEHYLNRGGDISIFVSSAPVSEGRKATLIKTTVVGTVGSIYDSTADFTIGAEPGGVNPMVVLRVTYAFLYAQTLSDGQINTLYQLTRPLFKPYTS